MEFALGLFNILAGSSQFVAFAQQPLELLQATGYLCPRQVNPLQLVHLYCIIHISPPNVETPFGDWCNDPCSTIGQSTQPPSSIAPRRLVDQTDCHNRVTASCQVRDYCGKSERQLSSSTLAGSCFQ